MPIPLNTHNITVTLCQSVFILNALIKVLIGNLNKSPHKYQKPLNRLLKVCYVSTTSAVLIALVYTFLLWPLTVLMKQTRQPVHAVNQYIYSNVYEFFPDVH